ncbi:LamG-like jellyroll fold domain-containing protein [Natrialba asiatica]|uniref:LamG-like jellyroll fold domain-containing protein n=1 Tax=Natrialba asiatica TaxID=64602 RepID=UPI001267DA78|nr:LamG-like jellyroll fold domain-containing protein [Natrialba asiatica]
MSMQFGVTSQLFRGHAVPDTIPDDSIAQWNLDEGNGSTAGDSQGSNDWSLNGPTWTSGSQYYSGETLDFGGDDYATLSEISSVSVNSEFTVSFWVTLDDVSSTSTLFSHHISGSNRVTIGVSNSTSGAIETALYDGSTFLFDDYFPSDSYNTGERIMVTLTWDGSSSGSFYLNTTAATNSGSNASTTGNYSGYVIGSTDTGQEFLNGSVDFAIAYDWKLSDTEVSDLYDETV